MRVIAIFRHRLRSLFMRTLVEGELDEELRYHLEREMDENIAASMSPEDARRAALRSIHGFEQRREECRDMRGLNLIENLRKDLAFAIRQLQRNLGFTCTAISVLALGMCASVSIFAFGHGPLIQPLPFRNPWRLAGLFDGTAECPTSNVSYPTYLA